MAVAAPAGAWVTAVAPAVVAPEAEEATAAEAALAEGEAEAAGCDRPMAPEHASRAANWHLRNGRTDIPCVRFTYT
ncbi:hypothetical protein F4561_005887 [Lipingzhangella halophila]|uniref:Uncharacterized protein n=1 Tax=Lipingzhangella halophila TaxID=1783352 RepID=A0A7W7W5R7_9ACTN|nr:hypothetical protein [Lipingzhangella halophila]